MHAAVPIVAGVCCLASVVLLVSWGHGVTYTGTSRANKADAAGTDLSRYLSHTIAHGADGSVTIRFRNDAGNTVPPPRYWSLDAPLLGADAVAGTAMSQPLLTLTRDQVGLGRHTVYILSKGGSQHSIPVYVWPMYGQAWTGSQDPPTVYVATSTVTTGAPRIVLKNQAGNTVRTGTLVDPNMIALQDGGVLYLTPEGGVEEARGGDIVESYVVSA